MATESIAWPTPPTGTDADDGPTAAYVMGCQFTVTETVDCSGIRWRVPDSLITPPAPANGHYAVLWNLDGGGRLAVKAFTPVPGGNQDIAFDSPVTLSSGVTYSAAVLTVKYTYRTGGGYPYETPDGIASSAGGKLAATSDPDDPPLGDTALIFYVSPLIVTGADPAEGTIDVGLGLAVAAAGARASAGPAALGLGLAVAAVGARPARGQVALGLGLAPAATGRAPGRGAVALGLGLAPAATGDRDAGGTTSLGLGLAAAVSGERDSEGSSVLGLTLAVSATGSSGGGGTVALGLNLAPSAAGARPSRGAVTLSLNLAPAADGARPARGVVAVGLGLAVAAAGATPGSSGVVALGLNLAVSATGTNGSSGRPVKPWPFPEWPVSSYPWAPRPVRSFSEVTP